MYGFSFQFKFPRTSGSDQQKYSFADGLKVGIPADPLVYGDFEYVEMMESDVKVANYVYKTWSGVLN